MPVTLPFDLASPAQREIKASELMSNYNALVNKFSAAIVDADVSTVANISGTKLASRSVTGDRIVLAGVSQNELGASSVGTAQIIDANVTTVKIADSNVTAAKILAASIAKDRLKLTVHEVAFSNTLFVDLQGTIALGVGLQAANPSVAFPKASNALIGWYIKNITITGGTSPTGVATLLTDDSGANWAGTVRYILQSNSGATLTISGTVGYLFLSLT